MRKIAVFCFLLLLTPALAPRAFAQDAPKPPDAAKPQELPDHFYRLDFVIQEVSAEGKATNSRSYTCTVGTSRSDRSEQNSTIRTGNRVPIITGASAPTGGTENKLANQYQYIDLGVNIGLQSAHEVGNQLALYLKTEISSLAPESSPMGGSDPVIRQNYWQSSVVIPLSKPTVVIKSDDLDTKGGMQVVVTATPLQ